jgi:hypothetical protein
VHSRTGGNGDDSGLIDGVQGTASVRWLEGSSGTAQWLVGVAEAGGDDRSR